MTKKIYCTHCKDKETNYNCLCWYEGWLMGEAEYEFNHLGMKINMSTKSKTKTDYLLTN